MGSFIQSQINRVSVFNDTVNSQRYLEMLRNDYLLKLLATDLPTDTQWFMQDGSTPHTDNVVLNILNSVFGDCVISNCHSGCHNTLFFTISLISFSPFESGFKLLWFFMAIFKRKTFPAKTWKSYENACMDSPVVWRDSR